MPAKKAQNSQSYSKSEMDTSEAAVIVDTTEPNVAEEQQPIQEGGAKSKQRVVITKKRTPVKEPVKEIEPSQKDEVLVDLSKLPVKSSSVSGVGSKKSIKQDVVNLFNEDDVDYRYIMMNYDFSKNKTMAKITKYEKALLVGKRAKQIEEGANPNIKVLPGQNAIQIAEEELRQRRIPLIIKRPIGNTFEYWRPADMEVIMD